MKLYGMIGAGGFGREVMPVAQQMCASQDPTGRFELVFIDDKPPAPELNGHRVLTKAQFLQENHPEKFFNITIANASIRERLATEFISLGITPFAIKAANHLDLAHNEVGEGAILCPFVTLTANVKIGRFFHANIYSYVAHDSVIGDFVTFAPRVHCNGNIVIEDYAYIGTAAVIKQGIPGQPLIIGRGAVVGMGAVVTKNVPPGATVVGNPAAPLVKHNPS